jgi:hypothetical protein
VKRLLTWLPMKNSSASAATLMLMPMGATSTATGLEPERNTAEISLNVMLFKTIVERLQTRLVSKLEEQNGILHYAPSAVGSDSSNDAITDPKENTS